MPQRTEHPSAERIMTTAPLNGWSKGWPKTHDIWSRRVVHATGTTMATVTTSAPTKNNPNTATVTATTSSSMWRRVFCPIPLVSPSRPSKNF